MGGECWAGGGEDLWKGWEREGVAGRCEDGTAGVGGWRGNVKLPVMWVKRDTRVQLVVTTKCFLVVYYEMNKF